MSPHRERSRSGSRWLRPRILRRYGDAAGLVNVAALAAALLLGLAAPMAARAAAATRILVYGDSLAAGHGLPASEAFPARLQAQLKAAGIDAAVINGGVSGDTTADGLARLGWMMQDHPAIVLLELGANDALRGIDPKLTYANLDRILAKLTASGAKVMLLGMLAPPNWGRAYQREFDAIYPRLAAKYHVPLYPFLLDGVALKPGLNQADGLHPNARGAAIIARKLAPMVERMLADTGAQG
jgi:acyl-CoA thioesterase I